MSSKYRRDIFRRFQSICALGKYVFIFRRRDYHYLLLPLRIVIIYYSPPFPQLLFISVIIPNYILAYNYYRLNATNGRKFKANLQSS